MIVAYPFAERGSYPGGVSDRISAIGPTGDRAHLGRWSLFLLPLAALLACGGHVDTSTTPPTPEPAWSDYTYPLGLVSIDVEPGSVGRLSAAFVRVDEPWHPPAATWVGGCRLPPSFGSDREVVVGAGTLSVTSSKSSARADPDAKEGLYRIPTFSDDAPFDFGPFGGVVHVAATGGEAPAFEGDVTIPTPVSFTDLPTAGSLPTSEFTIRWSGGSSGYVEVYGHQASDTPFVCFADASAGSLVVPRQAWSAFRSGVPGEIVIQQAARTRLHVGAWSIILEADLTMRDREVPIASVHDPRCPAVARGYCDGAAVVRCVDGFVVERIACRAGASCDPSTLYC